MSVSPDDLTLRVHRLEWAARDVLEVELRRPDGGALPAFQPGAHMDLLLPNGLTRSYSLIGDPADRDRYVIGVGLDANSRGGSHYIHTRLRVADCLSVGRPRNNFPLVEDAPNVVFLAGGIGVTPLYCMAKRLATIGRPFVFHYAVRDRDRAAFLPGMGAHGFEPRLHVDNEADSRFDIEAAMRGHAQGTHFYCCGPPGMMAAFEEASAAIPSERVHVEYFTPKEVPIADEARAFRITLARSGRSVEVGPDSSVLAALRGAGIDVPSSCEEGVCGTCEVKVLGGVPAHRDSVLSPTERAANASMMVCVSRCLGDELVLDL